MILAARKHATKQDCSHYSQQNSLQACNFVVCNDSDLALLHLLVMQLKQVRMQKKLVCFYYNHKARLGKDLL